MDPEFDMRGAIVLGSLYWDAPAGPEYSARLDEKYALRAAIIKAGKYDKLNPEMKALFDKAGVIADKELQQQADDVDAIERLTSQPIGIVLSPEAATYMEDEAILSTDAVGHQHKGKGTGGGQFTSTGGSSTPNPSQNLPKGSGEDGAREKAKQDIKWKDGATLIVGSNRANSSLPNETRPQLDDTERGALQNYSYQGDVPLHAKLRGQDYSWSHKTEEFIDELQKGLDSAFTKAPTMKTPVRVVRGMNPPQEVMEQFVKKFQQGQKTGVPVTIDDSYASTTRPGFLSELMDKMGLKDAVKKPFQGSIKLTIDACHGIDMMPFSKLTGESELLLPRGAQFDVVAVKQKGGTCHVHLKQRPPNAAPAPTASTPLAIRSDKPPLSGVEWRALVKFYRENPDRLKRWMNDGATVKVATKQPPPPGP